MVVDDDWNEQIDHVGREGTIRQTRTENETGMWVCMPNASREAVVTGDSRIASPIGEMNVQRTHRKTMKSHRRNAMSLMLRLVPLV